MLTGLVQSKVSRLVLWIQGVEDSLSVQLVVVRVQVRLPRPVAVYWIAIIDDT